jgi:predicted ATPase
VFVPGTKEPDESHRASQTDLPAQLTPLVGREQELEEACALLRSGETRLMTLTGPGGIGKTRLGIRVAEELADEFADGVCFDSLAPIREPELVIPTIARTLGLRELGERPLSERLGELLKERELLLVLDNFEQVVEAAPRVAELLAVCPRLKVLATSREVLHLSSERVFPVPPLGLPDVEQLPEDALALSEYGSVAFFVQRARMAKPDFRLTEENAPVVAEICVRLDGMPLAIELAAARLRLISPRAILERLRRRLRLLKGGPRDAPVRQKTLRDAIGWSYDLLGAEERLLFGRLSGFAGGCTLEAAEEVCDPGEDLTEDVLDLLASLMDKSLLNRAETEDGEGRFWMLETVKEYALERLEAAGEEEKIRRAHAAHYLALAEEARPELKGSRQTEWFDRLESEHDNHRAALYGRSKVGTRRWPCGWLRTCGGSGTSAATSARGAGGSKRPSRKARRRPPHGPRRSTGLVCWHATSPTMTRRGRGWRRAWSCGGSSATRRAHRWCSSTWAPWQVTGVILLKRQRSSRRVCV